MIQERPHACSARRSSQAHQQTRLEGRQHQHVRACPVLFIYCHTSHHDTLLLLHFLASDAHHCSFLQVSARQATQDLMEQIAHYVILENIKPPQVRVSCSAVIPIHVLMKNVRTPGSGRCESCGSNSASPAGSTSSNACMCDVGYTVIGRGPKAILRTLLQAYHQA
jgi:hypothetical protein